MPAYFVCIKDCIAFFSLNLGDIFYRPHVEVVRRFEVASVSASGWTGIKEKRNENILSLPASQLK